MNKFETEFECSTEQEVSAAEKDIADWLSDKYRYCLESYTIDNEQYGKDRDIKENNKIY